MTKEELQDIKTRYETVTPKDWNLDVRVGCLAVYTGEKINCMASLEKDKTIYYSDGYRDNEGVWQNYTEKENTASFIAHSITDIPKLIDEIEHLQSENTRLKAERDGWLVVLPCKVGDTVYIDTETFQNGRYNSGQFAEGLITSIVFGHRKYMRLRIFSPYVNSNCVFKYPLSSFGKTVFLTKEEAEKALKGGAE